MLFVPMPIYCCQECQETSSGFLVGQRYQKQAFPIHFYTNVHVLVSFMMFYDVKLQLGKSCCRGQPKQNITKSHMPIFITNTKLQCKPKSFFHCPLPLIVLNNDHLWPRKQDIICVKTLMVLKPQIFTPVNLFPSTVTVLNNIVLLITQSHFSIDQASSFLSASICVCSRTPNLPS